MPWPNFLGIGAQRCGTTWLDSALRGHPQVYLPGRRKEVHYFDQYYDRGPDWYQRFFPAAEIGPARKAIGEITPYYLYSADAAARIAADFPRMRLIAFLRSPVDRAYSAYGLAIAKGVRVRDGFRAFLDSNPEVILRGQYHDQIQRYFMRFSRSQIKILLFEEVMAGKEQALSSVTAFLGLEPAPSADISSRFGESRQPGFPRARALATRAGRFLRRWDLDWVINAAKSIGVERAFGDRGRLPPLAAEDRLELQKVYEPEIARLEVLLDRDLSVWRKSSQQA